MLVSRGGLKASCDMKSPQKQLPQKRTILTSSSVACTTQHWKRSNLHDRQDVSLGSVRTQHLNWLEFFRQLLKDCPKVGKVLKHHPPWAEQPFQAVTIQRSSLTNKSSTVFRNQEKLTTLDTGFTIAVWHLFRSKDQNGCGDHLLWWQFTETKRVLEAREHNFDTDKAWGCKQVNPFTPYWTPTVLQLLTSSRRQLQLGRNQLIITRECAYRSNLQERHSTTLVDNSRRFSSATVNIAVLGLWRSREYFHETTLRFLTQRFCFFKKTWCVSQWRYKRSIFKMVFFCEKVSECWFPSSTDNHLTQEVRTCLFPHLPSPRFDENCHENLKSQKNWSNFAFEKQGWRHDDNSNLFCLFLTMNGIGLVII